MQNSYYIDEAGQKDGPYDLITIMRRIRSKKIGPDTLIYLDDAETPIPASGIPDIAMFFSQSAIAASNGASQHSYSEKAPALRDMLAKSWHFTMEHNIITVFAGGILLLTLMLGSALANVFNTVIGGMIAWMCFFMFQGIYMVCVLRLYRGQTFSSDFFDHQLAPAVPRLLLASFVLGLMMAGGFFLLVIPGILIAVLYAFVPFLAFDRRYRLVELMEASRMLVKKHGGYMRLLALATFLHFICLALLIPIPLTLPMFTVILAEVYEQLSSL